MSSSIAGNENFTTVENIVGQLKVLDVNTLTTANLTVDNATVDDDILTAPFPPILEGLTVDNTALNNSSTTTENLVVNSLRLVDITTAAETLTLALPTCAVGDRIVVAINAAIGDLAGVIVFDASASGCTFTANNIVASMTATGNSILLTDQAGGSANTLTYTSDSATAANSHLNLGVKFLFNCTAANVWTVNIDYPTTPATSASDSTLAFA